ARSIAHAAATTCLLVACGSQSSPTSSGFSPGHAARDAQAGGGGSGDDAATPPNGGADPGSFGSIDSDASTSKPDAQGDCTRTFAAVIRDFKPSNESGGHPDFETYGGSQATLGLVKDDLGPDGKPQFASTGEPGNPMLHGKKEFDQWYND